MMHGMLRGPRKTHKRMTKATVACEPMDHRPAMLDAARVLLSQADRVAHKSGCNWDAGCTALRAPENMAINHCRAPRQLLDMTG
jgi:hypothetical protein